MAEETTVELQTNEPIYVAVKLYSYDALFNDFDHEPTEWSNRAISDDFLDYCQKRMFGSLKFSYADEAENLMLLIPESIRDESIEGDIINRLKSHFKHRVELSGKKLLKYRIKMGLFLLAGFVMLLITTVFNDATNDNLILNVFFQNILVPAGWFSIWEGLMLFFYPSEFKREYDFFKYLDEFNIKFSGYSE